MYITFAQAMLISFTIIIAVYLGHQSKIRLLKTKEKARLSKLQLNQALNLINPTIDELRKTNSKLQEYNKQQEDKRLRCFEDGDKFCDLCMEVGDCPFYKRRDGDK